GDDLKQQLQQQEEQAAAAAAAAAAVVAAAAGTVTAAPITTPPDPSTSQFLECSSQSTTHKDNNQLPSLLLEAIKKGDDLKLSLQEFEDAAQRVSNSDKLDLKKALAMLNQFNAGNPTNNRDKLSKVIMLLSGRPIVYVDKSIGTDNQPDKVKFVQNNVALQIIKIGHDKQATNTVNIGMYAWVISNVWKAFPVMGNLFLHRFYETCPYLLPRNVSQNLGQSEEEFYKAMGYRITSEACEKQDNYVTRMGAAAQLYGLVVALMAKYKISLSDVRPCDRFLRSILDFPTPKSITDILDHKPLLKIFGDRCLEDIPNPRLRNLKEKTLSYRFQMIHIPGNTGKGGSLDSDAFRRALLQYRNTFRAYAPRDSPHYGSVTM
ncbi:unnamed protein product, partial [Meganyctiphanes norvegica]